MESNLLVNFGQPHPSPLPKFLNSGERKRFVGKLIGYYHRISPEHLLHTKGYTNTVYCLYMYLSTNIKTNIVDASI